MGFFSNIKNRARGQIASVMPGDRPMATVNPVRPGTTPTPFGPRDFHPAEDPPYNLPRPIFPRKPKIKRGGLGGLFSKLQEQIRNQQIPQQDLDFLSRLPQNMMPQVDFSSLPQASQDTSNMPEGFGVEQDRRTGEKYFLQQLTPEQKAQNMIPERRNISYNTQDMMGDIQFGPGNQFEGNVPGYAGGRDVNIDDGGMVDFLNSDPRQKLFGIENRIGMLQNQLKEAEANRDRESFDMIVQEINNADAQRIEIMNSMKPNPINQDFQQRGFDQGRTISDLDDILSSLEKKN